MSALNNAFLRAYAKERGEPRRATGAGAPATLAAPPARPARATPVAPAVEPPASAAPPASSSHVSAPAAAGTAAPIASANVAARARQAIDHPLYAPRHDVPPPVRPLFGVRTSPVGSAPPVDAYGASTPSSIVPPPHHSPVRQPQQPQPQPSSTGRRSAWGEPEVSSEFDALEESPVRQAPPVGRSSYVPPPHFALERRHAAHGGAGRTVAPAPVEFQPAWEVDAFHWPAACDLAWDRARRDLDGIGEQLVQVNRHGLRSLGVTSGGAQEGRTTLALCLARAAAAQGLRTLLLDADVDNPQLALALGVDVRHDWTEVLSEALPVSEATISSLDDGLSLVPLQAGSSGRAGVLRLPAFGRLIQELTSVCDLVIVDLPSLDSHGFPIARPGHASPLDAAVLVRDVRRSTDDDLHEALRRMQIAGVKSVGILENFV